MAHKGVKTYYGGKLPKAVTINLTIESHSAMNRMTTATGASRTDLLEHGWRRLLGLPVNAELDAAVDAVVDVADPIAV